MSDIVETIRGLLPEGWDIEDEHMGEACLLVCPHDEVIEQDGTCPQGWVSPLREQGFI
jgi:hypothetical protein